MLCMITTKNAKYRQKKTSLRRSPPVLSEIDFQSDRTMITSVHIWKNIRRLDLVSDAVGDEKIVNPPTHILLSCPSHIGPPRVGIALIGMQIPEGIREARRQQFIEFPALLIGKASISDICLGILEVDLIVCNVQVAAESSATR